MRVDGREISRDGWTRYLEILRRMSESHEKRADDGGVMGGREDGMTGKRYEIMGKSETALKHIHFFKLFLVVLFFPHVRNGHV